MNKPFFRDPCEHGEGCYVGSFVIYTREGEEEFDLYIYHSPSMGPEACIRHGNGDSEYYSPGRLVDLIRGSAHSDVYAKAVDLLTQIGEIGWVKK